MFGLLHGQVKGAGELNLPLDLLCDWADTVETPRNNITAQFRNTRGLLAIHHGLLFLAVIIPT
jgi:hypothetical protein